MHLECSIDRLRRMIEAAPMCVHPLDREPRAEALEQQPLRFRISRAGPGAGCSGCERLSTCGDAF